MRTTEPRGSVAAAREIDITAPAEVVWDVLTDVEGWPAWNPDVRTVTLNGELSPGAKFRWRSGPGTITSTLTHVEAPARIGWTGKTLGVRAVHVWRLEQRGAVTCVRTEEAFSGPLARLFRRPLQKALETALTNGLSYLKSEAEGRAR